MNMTDKDKKTITEEIYPDEWRYMGEIMQAVRDMEAYSMNMLADGELRAHGIVTAIKLSFSPMHYKRQNDIIKASEKDAPECPQHHIKMTLKLDKMGKPWFWGCPRYPECDITKDYSSTIKGEKENPKDGVGGKTTDKPSSIQGPQSKAPDKTAPSAKNETVYKPPPPGPKPVEPLMPKVEFKSGDKFDPDKERPVAKNENDGPKMTEDDIVDYTALRAMYPNFPKVLKVNQDFTTTFECPKCHGPMADKRYSKKPGSKQPDFVCESASCHGDKKGPRGKYYPTAVWLQEAKDEPDGDPRNTDDGGNI